MNTSQSLTQSFKISLSILFAVFAVFLLGVTMAAHVQVAEAKEAIPSVIIEQCANGDMGQYDDCRETGNVGWNNSQVNTQNGHYAVGDFIPYRQILSGLDIGNQYCFGFGWDITQGGLPAVDYMATFTEDVDMADPTFQTIHDGSLASPDLRVAIPADPTILYGYWTDPANTFTGTLPATREIVVWGASSFVFGPYGWDNVVGDPPQPTDIALASTEQTSLEYCLIASAEQVVLSWSGHIAVPEEWGAPDRPSGSPYHMSNGTRQEQWTSPRTGESDLACVDPLGNITNFNVGRNETSLQVGEGPTAIHLQGITAGQSVRNQWPWLAAFIAFTSFTGLYILMQRRQHNKVSQEI